MERNRGRKFGLVQKSRIEPVNEKCHNYRILPGAVPEETAVPYLMELGSLMLDLLAPAPPDASSGGSDFYDFLKEVPEKMKDFK